MSAIDGSGQPVLTSCPTSPVPVGADDFHHAHPIGLVGELVSGAEPGDGSYIAQRMLASKSEKIPGAVLFFNLAALCVCGPGLGFIRRSAPSLYSPTWPSIKAPSPMPIPT